MRRGTNVIRGRCRPAMGGSRMIRINVETEDNHSFAASGVQDSLAKPKHTNSDQSRIVYSHQMRSIWHSKNCTCCPVSRVLFLCNFIFLSTSKSTFFQIFRTQNLYANATSNCQATTNSHDQIEIEIYIFYFFLAGTNFMVLNAKNSPAPARSALVLSASWGQKNK